MSAELIATLAVGAMLGVALLAAFGSLRSEIAEVRRDVGDLRERMARLEGLFEGFTRAEQPAG